MTPQSADRMLPVPRCVTVVAITDRYARHYCTIFIGPYLKLRALPRDWAGFTASYPSPSCIYTYPLYSSCSIVMSMSDVTLSTDEWEFVV